VLLIAGICSAACSASKTKGDTLTDAPVVEVVPDEKCPAVEPDLTTVIGAEFDRGDLRISVRTSTACNNHEFTVATCDVTEGTTTYRVSETNDCELPNDGVLFHVLRIERDQLDGAIRVEGFDDERVTVSR